MQNREFLYGEKKLFYRTTGEGPMIVLLHGFGEDGTIWKGQFDAFPNHCLLIPDLPGSGGSEAIEDMSMEGLADAVKAMMEALLPPKGGVIGTQPSLMRDAANKTTLLKSKAGAEGYPSLGGAGGGQDLSVGQSPLWGAGGPGAVLIGHSMGGYITLAFAEKYPGWLRAFGLFHSTAFADSEEKKETRKKGIRFIEEHGGAEFLKTATPNLYAPRTKEQHPEWIAEHLATVHNFSVSNLVSYYKAMMERPDRTAVLKGSNVPVLFVLGQHDVAVPLQDGLKQCYIPQLSYIHLLENAGHMGMIEEKEKANQIITQFVNTIETTA